MAPDHLTYLSGQGWSWAAKVLDDHDLEFLRLCGGVGEGVLMGFGSSKIRAALWAHSPGDSPRLGRRKQSCDGPGDA